MVTGKDAPPPPLGSEKAGTKGNRRIGNFCSPVKMGMVIGFDHLKELGNESAVKVSGRGRRVGGEYVMQDGDIIHFKSYIPISK